MNVLGQGHEPAAVLITGLFGVGKLTLLADLAGVLDAAATPYAAIDRRELPHHPAAVPRWNHEHRRVSHLAAHAADAVELAEIDRVLDRRLHDQIVRIVNHPPTYITKTLVTRPRGGELDHHWVKAVIDIETYRQTHDITDRRTTLGPQPPASDTLGRLDWQQASWTIDDARERLLPPTPCSTRPAPEPRFPSLDIGL